MNNQTTYLYAIKYQHPHSTPTNPKLLKDCGIIRKSEYNYSEVLHQLMTEVFNEDDVTEIHLYRMPNNIIPSLQKEDLWNELKQHF